MTTIWPIDLGKVPETAFLHNQKALSFALIPSPSSYMEQRHSA